MSDTSKDTPKDSPKDLPIIKELCLSGACNRGICYIGCFKKFEELDILKVEKILGVSIGAFIAVCYIIGYNADEMLKRYERF